MRETSDALLANTTQRDELFLSGKKLRMDRCAAISGALWVRDLADFDLEVERLQQQNTDWSRGKEGADMLCRKEGDKGDNVRRLKRPIKPCC